jgi:hypothetical protein
MRRALLLAVGLSLLPLSGQAAPPAEKRARLAGHKKKTRSVPRPRCRDIFCSSQSQVLKLDGSTADVKGLTEEQVEETMQTKRQRLEPCLIEARRRDPDKHKARVEFVVSGSGRVLAVRVDGKRGSTLARCIGKQMTGIRFPTFTRPRMVAAVTLAVPE